MKILGVDYGQRKLGLSVGKNHFAHPHSVLQVATWQDSFEKIAHICHEESIKKVVVGVSEEEMGEEQKRFAAELERTTGLVVDTWDETLTTKEAQTLAREAGVPLKRRRLLVDAYAATLMLQSYLEAHGQTQSS